jgi:hypothetical protein
MTRLTVLTGTGLFGTARRITLPDSDVRDFADVAVLGGHVVLRGWYFSDAEKARR